ncbi:hypothetical protein FRC15_009658, partial [Serendipita sp. 397]
TKFSLIMLFIIIWGSDLGAYNLEASYDFTYGQYLHSITFFGLQTRLEKLSTEDITPGSVYT